MTVRVLVVDDHPLFRYGLCAALTDVEDLTIVGEAADGADAVRAAIELDAHVVLMDLHMPGMSGIEAIQTLTVEAPHVAVLALSMLDNDESLFTALHAGARGYLVKGADRDEIIRAIHAVADGDVVIGRGIADRALAYFAAAPTSSRAARPLPELTDRELEVLTLMAAGLTNHQIATRLYLSEKTVRNHVSHIFARLHVDDRTAAVVRAHRSGIGTIQTPDESPGRS